MIARLPVPRRLHSRAVALLTATVAVLAAGVGLAIPASATPGGAPTLSSLTPATTSLTANWTTPAVGSDTFYRYDLYLLDTTTNLSSTRYFYNLSTLSYTSTPLLGGDSFSANVTVEYNSGTSLQTSNTLTATVPVSAPSALFFSPTASAGSGPNQAVVSWSPPAANGSPITGYTITGTDSTNSANNVSTSAGASATSVTVSGLTTGDSYTFTVTATNAIGTGSASYASTAVVARSTPSAPVAPTVTAGPGLNQAVVTWAAPSANGSAITGYSIGGIDSTSSAGNVSMSAGASATSATVSGLTSGDNYTFTVTASNGLGLGSASSASTSLIALGLPGIPAGVTGVASSSSIQLTWAAPGSTGGSSITGYLISYTDVATSVTLTQTSTGSGLTATVAGLLAAHSYTFTVAAITSVGTGTASTASSAIAIPVAHAAPGVARTVVATAVPGGAQVSWTLPADTGGIPVTGYLVTYLDTTDSSGTVVHTPGPNATTDTAVLHAGDHYAVTVTAANAVGSGPASVPATVVPFTTPGAPTSVAATAGDGSARVSWTAPGDGFSSITGYAVSYSDATHAGAGGSVAVSGGATSTIVTGLTDGDSYTFTVTATNAAGSGAVSGPSASVTPQATVVPAPVVRAVQAPTRVAVGGHGASTVPFRFTLDRPVPVTISLVAGGTVVGSTRLTPTGGTVVATVSVHLTRVAQLGQARWVVRATGSAMVLLTRGVTLKQSSMLGLRATRSGGRVIVTGSAKWSSLASGRVRSWAGARVQVQEQTAHGWKTITVARTDALGHISVVVAVAAHTRLRLVDTASPTVAAGVSAVSTV